jgi:hypothetical protein
LTGVKKTVLTVFLTPVNANIPLPDDQAGHSR